MIFLSDGYKFIGHKAQYPNGITHVFSYAESRGGVFDDFILFGLQYYLKKYFKPITLDEVLQYKEFMKEYCLSNVNIDSNVEDWMHIIKEHDGRLPLEIKAIPEGTVLPRENALFTIVNTDPKCYWLTNYVETLISNVWYSSLVATQTREIFKTLKEFSYTGDSCLDYKLVDFGRRGVTCPEQADIGGMAALLFTKSTDNVNAIIQARKYYGKCEGYSIFASEHSTITSWGREGEKQAYENMLKVSGPIACVMDSYNVFRAVDLLNKDKILNRDGVWIFRPDSGEPCETLDRLLNLIGNKFGTYTNSQGFKVLNDKIRIIWGDGINRFSIRTILQYIVDRGWSIDNLSLGSGGGLLINDLNRDTNKFAIKCSAAKINGEWKDVYKDPIGQPDKRSKRGRLKVSNKQTFSSSHPDFENIKDELVTVYKNGELLSDQTFEDIRNRVCV